MEAFVLRCLNRLCRAIELLETLVFRIYDIDRLSDFSLRLGLCRAMELLDILVLRNCQILCLLDFYFRHVLLVLFLPRIVLIAVEFKSVEQRQLLSCYFRYKF